MECVGLCEAPKVEKGFWSLADDENEGTGISPYFTEDTGSIQFPVPLAAPLNAEHVAFIDAVESSKPPPECRDFCRVNPREEDCRGTVEEPTAVKGWLCVYTGFEITKNGRFHGITRPSGSSGTGVAGTATTGATIAYEAEDPGAETNIRASGSWAMTPP